MKNRYWQTNQGLLTTTTGNLGVSNAQEISQSKYYKLRKEQQRILDEIEKDGFSLGEDGVLYFGNLGF